MNTTTQPRVLLVYYTYTQQTRLLTEAMEGVFRDRGCDVHTAAVELTDKRYAKRFGEFPMPHPFLELVLMIPPELRRATAEIRIPDEVKGDYDLVLIGSPTWWLSTSVPVRSFLKSEEAARLLDRTRFAVYVTCRRYWGHNARTVKKLGRKHGGDYADTIHFQYQGGQIRSLLSLLSYMGTGEYRKRFLGVKIPPTNLQPHHLDEARTFAGTLADELSTQGTPA
jgi:menaquinone-dependent protoporphyrinogen IX oxidase